LYRGRLAPSPTGYLHLGHARTFWTAQERVRASNGVLVLRNEDLDRARCRPEFVAAMLEDLRWFGLEWQEGPDRGGPFGPYNQSERYDLYRAAFDKLCNGGFIYPCTCSRKDIQAAASAPHAGDDELIYPGTCRSRDSYRLQVAGCKLGPPNAEPATCNLQPATGSAWRFRVPDGTTISFTDGHLGQQQFVAGRDFGDFVIWRNDDVPAYQLACVVDDAAMQITEVVRGSDLLISTARQLLLYRALRLAAPAVYHCPLLTDESGVRLAKRHEALSLRNLREQGMDPRTLR
jgi:glutamyl-tRNA synthetase